MICAGIDIGSRSIELVVVENKKVMETRQTDTGFNPISQVKKVMEGVKFDQIMATGYGRNLFEVAYEDALTVTEIKAHAAGVRLEFSKALAILDIGGQDSKAIRLNDQGRVVKFEMNDRCAAGTGKFLEIMAHNLGFSLDKFGPAALSTQTNLQINSMCTVFAESEVTSLIAKGQDRQEIARGLHLSVVKRAVGMLNRVGAQGPIVFSGGVAQNPCMVQMVADALKKEVLVPENPQMMGALGAAIIMAAKQ